MIVDKSVNTSLYKCGFVLSGGAYRSAGQIGALKALVERGIRPDAICGTSSGAIVAVLYANGYSPDEIFEIWQKEPFGQVLHIHFPKFGLLKSSKIGELIGPYMKYERLEELPVPTFITCTCMNNGRQEVFRKGAILQPLAAACSVPLLFEPVEIGGRQYVDGGLVSNLPVEPLAGQCERLIGIYVNPIPYKEKINGLTDMAYRSMWIGLNSTVQKNIPLCDWLISPEEFGEHGLTERSAIETLFNAGYDYTSRFLDEHGIDKG